MKRKITIGVLLGIAAAFAVVALADSPAFAGCGSWSVWRAKGQAGGWIDCSYGSAYGKGALISDGNQWVYNAKGDYFTLSCSLPDGDTLMEDNAASSFYRARPWATHVKCIVCSDSEDPEEVADEGDCYFQYN